MAEVDTPFPDRPVVKVAEDEGDSDLRMDDQKVPESLPREYKNPVSDPVEINEGEVSRVLHAIASTGKFLDDWETLKTILSFKLKQVLSEYNEDEIIVLAGKSSPREAHAESENSEEKATVPAGKAVQCEKPAEIRSRLNQALESFDEGPPFTLQRLCEILLSARIIYPKFSKLALALEKNLLVTSTLTPWTDTCSPIINKSASNNPVEKHPLCASSVTENGVDNLVLDKDEIMTEAEDNDSDNSMNIDTEVADVVTASDINSKEIENA